jgi:hypothetical protein
VWQLLLPVKLQMRAEFRFEVQPRAESGQSEARKQNYRLQFRNPGGVVCEAASGG